MTTLTTTQLAALPRVNLLPPEIAEQRRLKRVQAGLGAAVLAALGVVAVLAFAANGKVSDAQNGLDEAKARQASLQQQTAQYAEVPQVQAQVDAANAQLDVAVGQRVMWSYVLNDLSLKIPSRVWLTSMTVAQSTGAGTNGTATTAATATPGYLATGIGNVTFEGRAFAHNDVAAWLDALAKERGFTQPYFTESTEDPIGDNDSVKFSSTVTVTDNALAKNLLKKAGS